MLESRKIFFSGKSSYLLTLPKRWVEENGLKSGDKVLISVGKNFITIYPIRVEPSTNSQR